MSTTDNIILQVSQFFQHPAELVFDSWISPHVVRRFMFRTTQEQLIRCDIDARVGGEFVMTDRRADGDVEHCGRYLVITPPQKLVFSFGIPAMSSDCDLVSININPIAGGSELTLVTEIKPEWASYANEAKMAWKKMLLGLDEVLSQTSSTAGIPSD